MRIVLKRSCETDRAYISAMLQDLPGYAVVGVGPEYGVVSFGQKVAQAWIQDSGSVILKTCDTQQGKLFAKQVNDLDPQVWWKVIYFENGGWILCGTEDGKETREDALQEMTDEVLQKGARLVSYVNAGRGRGSLQTTSWFRVIGTKKTNYTVDHVEQGPLFYLVNDAGMVHVVR